MQMHAEAQHENKLPLDINYLSQVRAEALKRGISVFEMLEEASGYSPHDLIHELGRLLHIPPVEMKTIHALEPAFDILPFSEATRHECVLFKDKDAYLLVISDPFSSRLRLWAEEHFAMHVEWRLIHPADLAAFFAQQEKNMRAMDHVLPDQSLVEIQSSVEDLSLKTISEGTSQVVRLVHSTLYDAHKSQASDIHLEMVPGALSIKYRIDGVLMSIGVIKGADLAEQVISRIKVMSELDIAERRVPVSRSRFRDVKLISGFPSCPAFSAKMPYCVFSTVRRYPIMWKD